MHQKGGSKLLVNADNDYCTSVSYKNKYKYTMTIICYVLAHKRP